MPIRDLIQNFYSPRTGVKKNKNEPRNTEQKPDTIIITIA